MTNFPNVFKPGKIGRLELKNRLILPAMGSNLHDKEGAVTDELIDYHRTIAAGGVGMVTVEIAKVHPTTGGGVGVSLYDDSYIPGFKRLTEAVHKAGAAACIQLWHAGRQTNSAVTGRPIVSASEIPCPVCREKPKALSVEEIHELTQAYAEAARRAKEAGFDCIELHGAHGYLLAQFMSPYSNHRTDEYGGTLEKRARFPLEVIEAVRNKVGPDFPIIYRLSGIENVTGGITIEDTKKIAPMLVSKGVDAIHVSIGVYESLQYTVPPMDLDRGFNVWAATAVKEVVDVPVITVDRINTPELAEEIIASGKADFVAMGRPLLADPQLPNKAMQGRVSEIRNCIACNQGCVDRLTIEGKHVSCILNPACGRGLQPEFQFEPIQGQKKAVVVGGGAAGMEAARILSDRGAKVVLFESSGNLGGQWRLAGKAPYKYEIAGDVQWLVDNLYRSGVDVRLNTPATPELVRQEQPDVIILATGSVPRIPDQIEGSDLSHVFQAHEILEDPQKAGSKVVVVGGGATGLETAETLAELGKGVTVIEMIEEVAATIGPARKYFLMERLHKYGVKLLTNTRLKRITPQHVETCCDEAARIPADTVVIATGVRSVNDLQNQLAGIARLEVIGDALEPRKATQAFYEANVVARTLWSSHDRGHKISFREYGFKDSEDHKDHAVNIIPPDLNMGSGSGISERPPTN